MKKITLLLTLLITTLGYSQNLILDGDLENVTPPSGQAIGLLPGTTVNTDALFTTSQTAATRSTIVTAAGIGHNNSDNFIVMPNDFMTFRQPFVGVIGTSYTLKFWFQFTNATTIPNTSDGIYVSIRTDNGNNGTQYSPAVQVYVGPQNYPLNTWSEVTLTFTATETNMLLFFSKQATTASAPNGVKVNNQVRIDDISIVTESSLSVRDLEKFSFKIFPNPAKDYITVSAENNIDKVEIYNLLGQQVHTSTNNAVNISNLSNGTYIVKAYMDDKTSSNKFIKE